jgi:hypothetical protein
LSNTVISIPHFLTRLNPAYSLVNAGRACVELCHFFRIFWINSTYFVQSTPLTPLGILWTLHTSYGYVEVVLVTFWECFNIFWKITSLLIFKNQRKNDIYIVHSKFRSTTHNIQGLKISKKRGDISICIYLVLKTVAFINNICILLYDWNIF